MALLKEATINNKDWGLNYFTGTVVQEKKWTETKISGGGQTNGPIPDEIRTKNTRYDQIILKNTDGKERSFEFQEMDIACREGNVVTVIWAIPKGKDKGDYILVYNHQSDNYFWNDDFAFMFLPGLVKLPLIGNSSYWPLVAFLISPFVFMTIIPADWGLLVLVLPFAVYFGVRGWSRGKARKIAAEFLRSDPERLKNTIMDTAKEAA